MGAAELAGHFANHIVQIITVPYARQQWLVLFAYARPVDTTHVFVIKEVAVDAPRVAEHLLPLAPRVDRYAQLLRHVTTHRTTRVIRDREFAIPEKKQSPP